MKTILLILFVCSIYTVRTQIMPPIEWQKSLGGAKGDVAYDIKETADGGYIVAGSSYSNDGDAHTGAGVEKLRIGSSPAK